MLVMHRCEVEARLRQEMRYAQSTLGYSETAPKGHPSKSRLTLVAAQAMWAQHKRTCPICNKQSLTSPTRT
jgi:hypothetical protein